MPAPGDPHPQPDRTVTAASGPTPVDLPIGSSGVDAEAPPFDPPTTRGDLGVLGPYRVIRELGRGGMGAVYLAHDTRLNRRLALKVMLPRFAAHPSARERFLREARAAAQISHDNVVTVYEADERRGIPYIAMQFLQGSSLEDYLVRKGNLAIQQVLRVARETASGLAAAHKIGLVHRDIKPANLWLEAPKGRIKVLDFGLAKPLDTDVELTTSGTVIGTPVYMSPEQARGEHVDVRSDLFSLGAVLYRLCAGQLPFTGRTTMALLMALGTENPRPLRTLNPEVPEALADLIHQLLEKSPDRRPQNSDEVVKRIRAIMEGTGSANTATPPPVVGSEGAAASPSQVIHITAAESPSGSRLPAVLSSITPHKNSIRVVGVAAAVFLMGLGIGALYILRNLDNRAANSATNRPSNSAFATATRPSNSDPVQLAPQTQPASVTRPATPMSAPRSASLVTTPSSVPPSSEADTSTEASPERTAAKWVLSAGGTVTLVGARSPITSVADLPKDPFTLKEVRLTGRPVSSADLAHLKDLKKLRDLYLDGVKAITDAGLDNLADLKDLNLLWLGGTSVTDVGLGKLRRFEHLTNLGLRGTSITSAGLAQLSDNKAISVLYVSGKNITDAAIPALLKLPALSVLRADGCTMTDQGISQLKQLRNLKYLSLLDTKVSMHALSDFHATSVACQIICDGGIIPPGAIAFGPGMADLLASPDYEWTDLRPMAAKNIKMGISQADPMVTSDGLAIWYSARTTSADSLDIWVSRRADLNSDWQPPINAGPEVNTTGWESMPTLSANRLTMVFWRNPPFAAFETNRPSINDPWGPVQRVTGAQGAISPLLAPDAQELFMTLKGKVNRATRPDRKTLWSEPTVIRELSDIPAPQVRWISPDARAIIVLAQPQTAAPYYFITQRAGPDKPFESRKTLEFPPAMRGILYPFPLQTTGGLRLFFVQGGKIQIASRTLKRTAMTPNGAP